MSCLKEQKQKAELLLLLPEHCEICCDYSPPYVLVNRDPSWFNETWLGRIKEESEANWRLKVVWEAAEHPQFLLSLTIKKQYVNFCLVFLGQQLEKGSEKHAGVLP